MKKFLPLLFCTLLFNHCWSQQDRQFTHYMFDRMSFNPATTGFKGYCGTVIYRNQWDRVENAPNTTLFNFQGNLEDLLIVPGGIGVGLSYHNDVIGFQRSNVFTINGAYHIPTPLGALSVGVGVGFIKVGFDPSWIPPQTAAINDPTLSGIVNKVSQTGFDANAGLFWSGKENYYVGISTTHIVPADLTTLNYKVARHYYVMAGYKQRMNVNTTNPIYLKPGILVKADGSTMTFDLNIMTDFWLNSKTYLWGGMTYRYQDAVAVAIGCGMTPQKSLKKDALKFGYSFDIMTNPLNKYGRGTHELMVSYCLFQPPAIFKRTGNPFILQ